MTEHKVPNSLHTRVIFPVDLSCPRITLDTPTANHTRHYLLVHDRVDTEVLLYHDQTELEKKRKNQTISRSRGSAKNIPPSTTLGPSFSPT